MIVNEKIDPLLDMTKRMIDLQREAEAKGLEDVAWGLKEPLYFIGHAMGQLCVSER